MVIIDRKDGYEFRSGSSPTEVRSWTSPQHHGGRPPPATTNSDARPGGSVAGRRPYAGSPGAAEGRIRATSGRGHRAAAVPSALLQSSAQRRLGEFLMPAAVILAGVLLVVAFGFIVNRAMRDDDRRRHPAAPAARARRGAGRAHRPGRDPAAQPVVDVAVAVGQPRPSRRPRKTTPPVADHGHVDVDRAGVAQLVDLSGEGRLDWVHWGEQSTFSLERAAGGDFQILEGAPTAPRFRHAFSPQRFSWSGGSPVERSDGTRTGIRTCDEGNGFTLSVPAARSERTLRLYVGALAARGRLDAQTVHRRRHRGRASWNNATTSLSTAVFVVTYRAPKDGTLNLSWITEESFDADCGGVALQAATLR